METPYFRAGAGSVIYRDDGMILVFKRAGEDIWQFQQGGLDAGETPETALWRELEEETAIRETDIINTHPFPTWTFYEYPDGFIHPKARSICIGQAHRWWFLKLAPETTLDLTLAHDKEFEDWRWVSFAEFTTASQHSFKHAVY
jgi:putative (di)nucleoside polyphosphate hydrolase